MSAKEKTQSKTYLDVDESQIHTLVIVTGASRGFGRALSLEAATRYPHLELVLVGRTESALKETAALAQKAAQKAFSSDSTDLHAPFFRAHIEAGNLSHIDTLDALIDRLVGHLRDRKTSEASGRPVIDRALLLNNAGSLGTLQSLHETRVAAKEIQRYFDLNLTSCVALSNAFTHRAIEAEIAPAVVNVSSLAATVPFECMALYCVGKAARRMFHSAMAVEPPAKQVRTINFGPGIMKTGMQAQIRDSDAASHNAGSFLSDYVWKQDKAIPTHVSASCLFRTLHDKTKESGSDVDVYELEPKYAPPS